MQMWNEFNSEFRRFRFGLRKSKWLGKVSARIDRNDDDDIFILFNCFAFFVIEMTTNKHFAVEIGVFS